MDQNADNQNSFKNKVRIAVGILLLVLLVTYLFTTLLNLLLLVLAGALMAIYFHGCADVLKRKLKMGSPYALILSVGLNVVVIGLFFWFVGDRLNS